jgi:hypothetical protein
MFFEYGYTEMELGLPLERIHMSVVLETAYNIRKFYILSPTAFCGT